MTKTLRLRAALVFREEQLPRDTFSRQAAKVAKEKHEYFCNGFTRLLPFSSDFHDSSRLILAVARLTRNYALRVHSDPLAGRGPCDRPPWLGNQFPSRGTEGFFSSGWLPPQFVIGSYSDRKAFNASSFISMALRPSSYTVCISSGSWVICLMGNTDAGRTTKTWPAFSR